MQKSSHSLERQAFYQAREQIRPRASGSTPFTGGCFGDVGRYCACRSLAHYAGCWRYHWDLFEYLLVSLKREYGGSLHTVGPGYILVLVGLLKLGRQYTILLELPDGYCLRYTHHDHKRDPGAALRNPQEEPDLSIVGKQ
jgi:hypothetical protein